ncbi:S49 family peptidase [uncultured Photobacterium sp.]|uniref:S49 family peptidase n=1 Tax=uncultured Photobacterium sp. TaxID=173973 RepID=UPI00261E0A86|nr:S49 family peptidase [uncultured Photobacterium sp.]
MATLKNHLVDFMRRYRNNTRANYIKVGAIVFGVVFAIGNTLYINHFFNMPVPHIALIKLEGNVERGSNTGDGVILSEAIERAMNDTLAHAIIVEANSPGGSPVQAEQLHRTIMSMRDTTNKPIYFSIGELCASACLYIASSADMVFAHKNSLIGSVGVRMDGWGFDKFLEHIDIERRTYSAGKHKTLLDPFKPRDPDAEAHLKTFVLEPLYGEFVSALKEGRGDKLDTNNENLFTGLLWTGAQAKSLGLVDDIKTHYEVRTALQERYQVEMIQNYSRANFSISKLLTSEFWADVVAKAWVKVNNTQSMAVEYK